jgi:hypothetical protein
MGAHTRILLVVLGAVMLAVSGCATGDDVALLTGSGTMGTGGDAAASSGDGSSGPATDQSPFLSAPEPTVPPPPLPPIPTVTEDPDTWPAASERPTEGYFLLAADATVELGGVTYEFSGLSQEAAMRVDVAQAAGNDMSGRDYIASCGFNPTVGLAEDGMAVQGPPLVTAEFRREQNYEAADSFSFADNANGTVLWGLHLAAEGQEWSGTGAGQAHVTFKHPTQSPHFQEWHRHYLYGVYVWSGVATENFSLEKRPFSSEVICLWAPKSLEGLED